VRGRAKYPYSEAILHQVAESVWVCLGILVEQFAGRRFSHQSPPFWMRSIAAPCGTDIVYIKLIVMCLCRLMRGSAVRCGGDKITFRVRCIQPGSATSPLCFLTPWPGKFAAAPIRISTVIHWLRAVRFVADFQVKFTSPAGFTQVSNQVITARCLSDPLDKLSNTDLRNRVRVRRVMRSLVRIHLPLVSDFI
jgi:hypothetical protein